MPQPSGGLIRPRSHTLGPKMYLVLLGWQRPVRDWKADRMVRLRPSLPTARSFSRISESALRSSRIGDTCGIGLGHRAEGVVVELELAGLGGRPRNAVLDEPALPAIAAKTAAVDTRRSRDRSRQSVRPGSRSNAAAAVPASTVSIGVPFHSIAAAAFMNRPRNSARGRSMPGSMASNTRSSSRTSLSQ